MSGKVSFPRLLIFVAGVLGLTLIITGRTQSLADGVPHLCQSLRLCSPTRPDDIQGYTSGWAKQSDFSTQVGPELSRLRAKYPDFNIEAVAQPEIERSGPFKTNVERKYPATFVVTPKWRGLFGIIGDMVGLSENSVAGLFTGTLLLALVVFLWPSRRKAQPAS